MSHINSNIINSNSTMQQQQQDAGQNENENHLIGNILAEEDDENEGTQFCILLTIDQDLTQRKASCYPPLQEGETITTMRVQ